MSVHEPSFAEPHPTWQSRRQRALDPVLTAAEEEQRIREDAAERASFSPHLWAMVEHEIGHPIFLVALVGQDTYRRIDLPEGIEKMNDKQQATLVGRIARIHFIQKRGDAGPFGKIVGYVYRHTFDEGWNLTTYGQIIDRAAGRVVVGKYTLSLKKKPGKDISFRFSHKNRTVGR
jgi:hypothetical protein